MFTIQKTLKGLQTPKRFRNISVWLECWELFSGNRLRSLKKTFWSFECTATELLFAVESCLNYSLKNTLLNWTVSNISLLECSKTYISNYQEVDKFAWKRMFVCWTNIVQTLHFFTFPLQSLIVENNWHTKKELQENIPHKSCDVELFWRALKSIDFFFLFNGCKNDFTKHFMNYYVMMKLQFLPTFPRRLNMLMFFCRLHRNDDDNIKVQKNRIWCGGKLLG